jgi:hypothetical protein
LEKKGGSKTVTTGPEFEFEEIERQEREARLRLEAAREQKKMDEGEAQHERPELIRKLEEEWEQAVERLRRLRES